ncbi:hypothetical protein CALVIDRAFT_560843 [Calocera viscosa TUFC12733]|uniref:Uncharacterized protein n=1 Tax=Calocera viscosa (strain TUFC12733) TaxID=1330018 RepID=A0A167QUD8_CALVF|nr:hypothetical protein CALVIDRAFT_560843 [Calocera viscosa TUFC12733]
MEEAATLEPYEIEFEDPVDSIPLREFLDEADTSRADLTLSVLNGDVTASSQTQDYIYRPEIAPFSTLCLYDYIALSEKEVIPKAERAKPDCNHRSDSSEDDSDDADSQFQFEGETKRKVKGARGQYQDEHPQARTHRARRRLKETVPVLLGPSLPNRDGSEEERDIWNRAMMILFVPWRCLEDLKLPSLSWTAAFNQRAFKEDHLNIMENMNVLRQCKDARDSDLRDKIRRPTTVPVLAEEPAIEDLEDYVLQDEDLDNPDMDEVVQADDDLHGSSEQAMFERQRVDREASAERLHDLGVEELNQTDASALKQWRRELVIWRKDKRPNRDLQAGDSGVFDIGGPSNSIAHGIPETKRKAERNTPEDDVIIKRQRTRVDVEDEVMPDDMGSQDEEEHVNRRLFPEASQAKQRAASPHTAVTSDTERSDDIDAERTLTLARPTAVVVEGVSVDMADLDLTMQQRVNSMRSFSDAIRGVYYVTACPLDLRFGYSQGIDMSNFLVRQDNMAVTIWILGRIVVSQLEDDDGSWPDQVYVSVKPLTKADTKAAARIVNTYSKPAQNQELNPFGTVMASRFQKKYQSPKPPSEFKQVYDARELMAPKRDLKHWPCAKLKKGDLILMDMRIRKRFDSKDADIDKDKRAHTIAFQLNTIYLLCEGSEDDDDDRGVVYNF